MKKIIFSISLLLAALSSASAQPNQLKSVCPSCLPASPTTVEFCAARIGDLCITNDLTVCGTINGSSISLDSELAFTANNFFQFTLFRANPVEIRCFDIFPVEKLQICGSLLQVPNEKGITVLGLPFGIPKNLDTSITPVVDIHFFTAIDRERITGGFVNFGVGTDFLQNLEETTDSLPYSHITGNIPVTSPDDNTKIKHYMISVELDGSKLKPQTMCLLYIARIGVLNDAKEYASPLYFACMNFRYRTLPLGQ